MQTIAEGEEHRLGYQHWEKSKGLRKANKWLTTSRSCRTKPVALQDHAEPHQHMQLNMDKSSPYSSAWTHLLVLLKQGLTSKST
jgi:hypothetical protein